MTILQSIETALPRAYAQADFSDVQQRLIHDPHLRRCVEGIYEDCGISTRHSVVADPASVLSSAFYGLPTPRGEKPREPSTKERNDRFAEDAPRLAVAAARQTLERSGFRPEEITDLITVTCTGFYSPGLDLALARELSLAPGVARYQLGFLGCSAALPALRMAQQFCRARQEAVVLIVCIELCSLHFHFREDLDTIVANSLFSDGAAAAIVSSSVRESPVWCPLRSFASSVLPDSADRMAWRIGNHGFDMVLSRYVPRILGSNIRAVVSESLARAGVAISEVHSWALHPGGKSILDKVQKSLDLDAGQLDTARGVLKTCGNMSSATILFVLKTLLECSPPPGPLFAAAFGPGLTVESALLEV